jgi:hypothetical protein
MEDIITIVYSVAGVEMQTQTDMDNLDNKLDEIGFGNVVSITSGSNA